MQPSAYQDHSVVRQVNRLIEQAIAQDASDIHLEPNAERLRVRFRIDGVLYDQTPFEKMVMHQVISRLKVLAKMNIAEKRLPQDGKYFLLKQPQAIDLRISTFPSLFGEKMVIRILDRAAHALSLDQLGFLPKMMEQVISVTNKATGFFLVTGPTGSGKTTTLYAILSTLHDPQKNIVTLEDPVEYNLEGITQGPINPDAGFTFEQGIRSLLRQDPDILMVGEVRDKQTARTTIEAALTGHMVFSTLHTNDAPSAVMRLMDMGIEPYLINASLSGILAQRLVRKICQFCKEPIEHDIASISLCKKLGISENISIYHGKGCVHCDNMGNKGRIGIFELLLITPALRNHIITMPKFDVIQAHAIKEGMTTLLKDGIEKVKEGTISLSELARVVI